MLLSGLARGGVEKKSRRRRHCRPPLPFDLPYLPSSISGSPTLRPALIEALLCTCVNAVALGSGKGESELAEMGMWIFRADDGLDRGWLSDVLM